ncbi:MAG: extracellular solute-binding protein [Lachnospiraceae bacterium]|nr:extracellular solute-binding protein [Lachnospiraceae bacterium]
MRKKTWVKGLCLLLAGVMVFSLGGCKKKSSSIAEEARKNAKNAVFHKEKDITTDFTPSAGKAKGSYFILTRSDNGSFQYAIGKVDGSISPSVTVNLESEQHYVSSQYIDLGPDGSVYFVDSLSDYDNNKFSNDLVHLSADGKEIGRCNLGEKSPFGITVTKDGSIVLRYESELGVYDANLSPKKTITNPNGTQSWTNVIEDGNDVLLFVNESASGNTVHKVDLASGTIGATIPYTSKMGTQIAGEGYNFYIVNAGNGVTGVDLSKNTLTEVFNFMDSDVDSSDSLNVTMFDAEHALVMTDYFVENPYIAIFKKVPPNEVPDKEYITLGGFYINNDTKKIITKFNTENPKYKIRVIDYSEYNTQETEFKGGYTVFKGDVATGKIPDIIMTDGVPNMESYINKGLFTDLTPLMEKDGLKKSDYLDNIIEAGSKDGKLYNLIPFFYVQGFMMSKENLNGQNGISIDDYMALEKKYNNAGISMWYTTKDALIEYALAFNTTDYLDVKTGKCNFDSEDFKKVLTFANEFSNDQAEMEKRYGTMEYIGAFAQNRMLLNNIGMGSFRETFRLEQSMFGGEAAFIGFPNLKGDSRPVIQPGISVAISSKSPNKESAFEFVKMLISEDFQTTIDNGSAGNNGLPVLKSAFEAMAETSKEPFAIKNMEGKWEPVDPENNTYTLGGKEYTYKEINDTHLEYLKGVAKSAKTVKYKEDKILNLINEESAAYFAGQKSADEVAKIINSRVDIYVKENN